MVNSVSFGVKRGIYDAADLNAPQSNQRQTSSSPVAPKKKHSAAKAVFGTVAVVALVAGALALGHAKASSIQKGLESIADKKDWLKWVNPKEGSIGRTVLRGLSEAGKYITDKSKDAYKWVAGKFTRSAAVPEEPLEEILDASGSVL